MPLNWEILESGPADAEHTVLLLPGGLSRSRSYQELMAQHALAGNHLVAVTLPGHGGTPPPDDYSIENYARLVGAIAQSINCDAVVGFSIGATVAIELVTSGFFDRPAVLLGPSLSSRDEPLFLHAMSGLGNVLGSLPSAAMLRMVGMATKHARVSPERRTEILEDFQKNDPRSMRQIFKGYLAYLDRSGQGSAERLCGRSAPTWFVHAEKGDGGLTSQERTDLESCASATIITIPGTSYFMPNEEPELVASLVAEALASSG
jgi:pimeloyl-ACP methyl ester carboxylesterase